MCSIYDKNGPIFHPLQVSRSLCSSCITGWHLFSRPLNLGWDWISLRPRWCGRAEGVLFPSWGLRRPVCFSCCLWASAFYLENKIRAVAGGWETTHSRPAVHQNPAWTSLSQSSCQLSRDVGRIPDKISWDQRPRARSPGQTTESWAK